jgi:hypothetical protein
VGGWRDLVGRGERVHAGDREQVGQQRTHVAINIWAAVRVIMFARRYARLASTISPPVLASPDRQRMVSRASCVREGSRILWPK